MPQEKCTNVSEGHRSARAELLIAPWPLLHFPSTTSMRRRASALPELLQEVNENSSTTSNHTLEDGQNISCFMKYYAFQLVQNQQYHSTSPSLVWNLMDWASSLASSEPLDARENARKSPYLCFCVQYTSLFFDVGKNIKFCRKISKAVCFFFMLPWLFGLSGKVITAFFLRGEPRRINILGCLARWFSHPFSTHTFWKFSHCGDSLTAEGSFVFLSRRSRQVPEKNPMENIQKKWWDFHIPKGWGLEWSLWMIQGLMKIP